MRQLGAIGDDTEVPIYRPAPPPARPVPPCNQQPPPAHPNHPQPEHFHITHMPVPLDSRRNCFNVWHSPEFDQFRKGKGQL